MKKTEPWRIIVGILAIVYILFMWVKKDMVGIYNTMPAEQIFPLIVTTVGVTLVKIALFVGVVLLVKWVFGKRKHN